MAKKQTQIIAGFPGIGKSYFHKNTTLKVLDSDSSTFDKTHFPQNYIDHIKENLGKVDIILVSTHEEVRKALVKNDLFFTLVYPSMNQKDDYKQRYIHRGSPDTFIQLLNNNWNNWIIDCFRQKNCVHVLLSDLMTLSDVIK